MFWIGKLLGCLFGYMVAGPFGAIFGLLLGHYFDLSRRGHWSPFLHTGHTQAQDIFFQATFTVMGYVAKSDGRISESEIAKANSIMQYMMLSPTQRQQAILFFQEGKQTNFTIDPILDQLLQRCYGQVNLLHLFVDIQLQATYADGPLSPKKYKILEYICYRLNLNPFHFLHDAYYSEKHYTHSNNNSKTSYPPSNSLELAYKTLGINASINNVDLKKVYRKLMSQNHPDKLVSKGLPEEMLKLATQKTQEIKIAYETICRARGL